MTLRAALTDFAVSLSRCYLERDYLDDSYLPEREPNSVPSTNTSSLAGDACDYAETDDERVIRTSFIEFSKIIRNVEEARKTMLVGLLFHICVGAYLAVRRNKYSTNNNESGDTELYG
ncbi:unnamed protein product [Echinostoma caproni]|uniref:Miff domain-containing protein n=1 Tax=Echinostoma caproni TaxID=27848 RepID=A0A183AN27_9TREM|nr:unnamed protein product [Echinostoma caproni]